MLIPKYLYIYIVYCSYVKVPVHSYLCRYCNIHIFIYTVENILWMYVQCEYLHRCSFFFWSTCHRGWQDCCNCETNRKTEACRGELAGAESHAQKCRARLLVKSYPAPKSRPSCCYCHPAFLALGRFSLHANNGARNSHCFSYISKCNWHVSRSTEACSRQLL